MLLLKSLGWIGVVAGTSFLIYLVRVFFDGALELRGKDQTVQMVYRHIDPGFFYAYWGALFVAGIFILGLGWSVLRKPR